MCVPKVRHFPISLLVCEFSPHRQTCYQNFIRTYPPLRSLLKMCKSQSYITGLVYIRLHHDTLNSVQ